MDLSRVFLGELRVVGARVHQRRDFERAVELLTAGVIPADRVITHIAPLTATADAFAALASGQQMKVLIDLAQL
jgi:threonine dehydrogenase-like Zn-dependent dehydrogenase